MDAAPPCIMRNKALNPCARARYAERVLGHLDLPADWAGWRLRGRWLISPEGDRMTPERLRGLMFRECLEQRQRKAARKGQQEAKVVALAPAKKKGPKRAGSEP